MSRSLFWLSDEAWLAIEPYLPRNQPGARRVDDRRVISGILHVLKSGCRWCDCPADYGPSTTVYNRFNRWSRRGFWTKRSEEHTSELQSLMRTSYAVFCLKKKSEKKDQDQT